jgi:hypothetical protein
MKEIAISMMWSTYSKMNVSYFQNNSLAFSYKLGKCGDLKLDWFGDMLNNYIGGLK